jgi:hypothetical protein
MGADQGAASFVLIKRGGYLEPRRVGAINIECPVLRLRVSVHPPGFSPACYQARNRPQSR